MTRGQGHGTTEGLRPAGHGARQGRSEQRDPVPEGRRPRPRLVALALTHLGSPMTYENYRRSTGHQVVIDAYLVVGRRGRTAPASGPTASAGRANGLAEGQAALSPVSHETPRSLEKDVHRTVLRRTDETVAMTSSAITPIASRTPADRTSPTSTTSIGSRTFRRMSIETSTPLCEAVFRALFHRPIRSDS